MIDITGVNMIELVKKAYDLSRPQGMGMMHFTPDPLTDEEAKSLIQENGEVSLDYVGGRACKFHVRKKEDQYFINDSWFDHSPGQLIELLAHVDIVLNPDNMAEHCPTACNCDPCRNKRGLDNLDPQKDFEKAIKAHEDGTAFKIKTFKADELK